MSNHPNLTWRTANVQYSMCPKCMQQYSEFETHICDTPVIQPPATGDGELDTLLYLREIAVVTADTHQQRGEPIPDPVVDELVRSRAAIRSYVSAAVQEAVTKERAECLAIIVGAMDDRGVLNKGYLALELVHNLIEERSLVSEEVHQEQIE